MDCKTAILKTLIYSDLFNYPLTFDQLYLFLMTEKTYSKNSVKKQIQLLKQVVVKDGFYVLKGKESNIASRRKKQKDNKAKLQKAKKIANVLSFIPTIYFIGVSGSLAMENAQKQDDIDFFVITKKNTLWITRLASLFLLQILGVRRKRDNVSTAEKICLNMIISEDAMTFAAYRKDIYTAHEIAQVLPIIDREKTYERFLQYNSWVKTYMHNAFSEKKEYIEKLQNIFFEILVSFPLFEYTANFLQQVIINKHKTSETVTKNFLAFHPKDYRSKTLDKYQKLLTQYV